MNRIKHCPETDEQKREACKTQRDMGKLFQVSKINIVTTLIVAINVHVSAAM